MTPRTRDTGLVLSLPAGGFFLQRLGLLAGLLILSGTVLLGDDLLDQPGVQRLPAVEPLAAPAWLKPADDPVVVEAKKTWTGSLELGLNGSDGNTVNFNLHTGFDFARQTSGGVFEVGFDYAKVNSDRLLLVCKIRAVSWNRSMGKWFRGTEGLQLEIR